MREIALFVVFSSVLASQSAFAKDSLIEWKSDDGTEKLNIGGLVRLNQRYESWEGDPNNNTGVGKLHFDILRLDAKGKMNDAYFNASYVFQDQNKTSIEKAYVGYNVNKNNSVEAGFVYKPFVIYPYPQNGWTYQIPFFLGYGNNIAPGVNWNYSDPKWDVKAGYYPTMLNPHLRYSPESGAYKDLSNTLRFQRAYQNEKRNQINTRIARKFDTSVGKQEIGLSGAVSQLHNTTTDENGKYYAVGVHANNNYQQWNVQSSIIHYKYDAKNPAGVNSDMTLMGANGLTPAYFIASEGTVAGLNVAYTIPMQNKGKLKVITLYDDYSYFDKEPKGWASSQMNTIGVKFLAPPFTVWTDYTIGKNANIIGGATNGTGFTTATSKNSDKWLYRVNVNLGYSF